MKKFFRTLALVLALTLVIGTIPAAAADEVKPLTKKTLYIDGAKGTDADGKQSTYKAKVALYKLAGYKTKAAAEGVEISAETADTKVKVTKNYVYAQEIGLTNVTLTVDGKDYTVAINVKKNAEAVTVKGIENGEKFVGETVEFSLPRKGVDTDARRVTVNGEPLKDIEGKDRQYTYTFAKAGKYEFICEAYQGSKYNKATATEKVVIDVVEPKMESVKQVADNAFEITFNGPVEGLKDASSFASNSIYYMVQDTVIPFSLIKEAKVDKDNKNVLKVTMYSAFKAKETYYVALDGVVKDFEGAGTGKDSVEKVVIETKEATVNETTEIKVKLYNALGIDITSSVGTGDVTCTLVEGDAWATGNTIRFFDEGKVAKVKASLFIKYDSETWQSVTVDSEVVEIKSVPKAETVYTGEYKLSYEPSAAAYIKENSTLKTAFPAEEKMYVQILFKCSDGVKDPKYTTIKDMGFDAVTIGDENIALIMEDFKSVTDGAIKLYGVKAGTTNLIFYRKDAAGNLQPKLAIPVTVTAKRAIDHIKVTAEGSGYVNIGNDNDSFKVTIEVLDNYNQGIASAIDIKQDDANKTAIGALSFTEDAVENKGNGKYIYTIKNGNLIAGASVLPDDGKTASFRFYVQDTGKKATAQAFAFVLGNTKTAKAWSLNVSNKNLSIAVTDKTKTDDVKKSVISIATVNGQFVTGVEEFSVLNAAPTIQDQAGTGSGITYAMLIYKDGTVITEAAFGPVVSGVAMTGTDPASYTGITLTNISLGALCTKGTYKFVAYKIEKTATKTNYTVIGQDDVVVTDAGQIKPVYTIKYDNRAAGTRSIDDCFEWKFNGSAVTTAVNYDDKETADNGNILVKSAKVTVKMGVYDDMTFTVPINTVIKFK